MKRLFLDKTIVFLFPLTIITFISLYICYNYSMTNYKNIEEKQNNQNIENFVHTLNILTSNSPIKEKHYYDKIKKICIGYFDECLVGTTVNSKKLDTKRIKIETYYSNMFLINDFRFFNLKDNLILRIKTKSKQDLIITSKKSIQIFSSITIIFLIITIIITNIYQKHMLIANDKLEEKVSERTNQINHTIKELEKVNLRLFDLAHTDYLTQIKNRRSFFLHADMLFKKMKKSNQIISIIMIDIDNFKNFNDTYGHEIGDKVLKLFAKTINSYLKGDAIFGRLGGEEFVIALPHKNLDSALIIAEEIRIIIEKLTIKVPYSELFITASFGVSDSINANSIDEIIKHADDMLYDAKRRGKNRVRSRLS